MGIPDGWLNYSKTGSPIGNTPFVCFRVPLRKGANSNLPENERWTVQEVLQTHPNLGMVIDLTCAKPEKYYNSNEFISNGVKYEKLRCEGHQVVPQKTIDKFKEIVNQFLEEHPQKLIGVHCTHGVNRTGYVICSYLIQSLRFRPYFAIEYFALHRGHSIERNNYVQSLLREKQRY